MPKDRRVPSLSSNQAKASPYPCRSKKTDQCKSKNLFQSDSDEMEWEEARCPICMEPPHNAVLLLCSSHEKGCRTYMCDTSYRHSNCLNQFCKSLSAVDSTEEVLRSGEEQRQHKPRRQPKPPLCPLCRGQVNRWIIIEPARRFMNSKPRSCSLETCDFSGTYLELREHARLEHPSVRPTEADPERLHDWMRLERERNFQDILSAAQLESRDGEEWGDWMMGLGTPFDDIADIFEALQPESEEEEWDDNLHMDIGIELPFTFFEGLDSWLDTSVSGSSGVGGRSPNRGTTAGTMVTSHHPQGPLTSGTNGSLSWGSRSDRHRRANQR
ncbi:hypothetical protein U1Q18_027013 [Sarracenia purpurea var. burkii]